MAEKLSEVVALREDNRDGMVPVWDQSGVLKSMRTRPTVPLPQNSEELRIRLGILGGAAWVMCGMSQTRNPLLADLSPDLFSEYADYLLGEHVWGLTAHAADGKVVGAPSWALLLSYEVEIRSKA